MAKNRIIELKQRMQTNMMTEFLGNQEREREEVEQAHLFEYSQFNKTWDDACVKLQQEHQLLIQQLEDKHTKELEENRVRLDQELSTVLKPSSELLNLRRIQENLGIQGE